MSLSGSQAKLNRGKEHLAHLRQDVIAFFRANPYSVIVERPADGLYVVRADKTPVIPTERWALVVGDCVHNLRCSLDYMAWELAGAKPMDTETQFPIFDTKHGWDARAHRRVKRMPPAARERLEAMQPYHSAHPERSALAALRRLDDADKHKLLTLTIALHERLFLQFEGAPEVRPQRVNLLPDVALVQGAILATFVFGNDARAGIDVLAHFTPMLAFGETVGLGARIAVMPSLENVAREVERISASLASFFKCETPAG